MALIFTFSSIPAKEVGGVESTFQLLVARYLPLLAALQIKWLKVGHIVGYAALGLVFRRSFASISSRPGFWSVLACLLFAVTDELHQSFVPGRGASVSDVFLDTVTVVVVMMIASLLETLKHRRNPNPQPSRSDQF